MVGGGLLSHAGERGGRGFAGDPAFVNGGSTPAIAQAEAPRLRQVSVDNSLPIVAALAAIVAVIATVVAWRAGRRARRAADLVAQLLEPPVLEPVPDLAADVTAPPLAAPDLAPAATAPDDVAPPTVPEPPVEPTPTIAAPALASRDDRRGAATRQQRGPRLDTHAHPRARPRPAALLVDAR